MPDRHGAESSGRRTGDGLADPRRGHRAAAFSGAPAAFSRALAALSGSSVALAGALAALALAGLGAGCVGRELDTMNETEAEYRRCVETHSASYGECRALREQMLSEQQRYEDTARRRWACDPASEDCPTPR